MAKIQIKSEKLTPFGGIFSIMEQFDALLAQTIENRDGNTNVRFNQRETLVKDHAFLVKPAYYLKSLYGVRGFCVCDVSVVQGICTIK